MSDEVWLPAPDFPTYEVSNLGNVRSLAYGGKRNSLRRFPRIKKQTLAKDGYLRVTLCRNSRSESQVIETWLVHRLVMCAFRPNEIATNLDVAHLDGNKTNNVLSNLVWATRKENESHKILHGTRAEGERNGQHKICGKCASAIRHLAGIGVVPQRELANAFGVSQSNVSAILLKKSWNNRCADALLAELAKKGGEG